jgi:hypothetical protein
MHRTYFVQFNYVLQSYLESQLVAEYDVTATPDGLLPERRDDVTSGMIKNKINNNTNSDLNN